MKKIYIIHENDAWVVPLRKELKKLNYPFEEWFVDKFSLDLNSIPPEGIFYNRMSASAHTREHRYAPEFTENILAWLELHDRTIVNGRRAIQLELRKSEQYLALQKFDIKHPNTFIVNDKSLLIKAVQDLDIFPFILKPNRGGKGTGVQLFQTLNSLEETLNSDGIGESLDGIWLVQQYIKPKNDRIVRAEFVGGEFLYAVSIDSSGGFQLCPADVCQVSDAFCPADGGSKESKFKILDDYENFELVKYANFLRKNNIGIGAIEYVENENGEKFVYDVNTNTNYNSKAEEASSLNKSGMKEIAKHLGLLLDKENVVTEYRRVSA